MHKKGFKMDKKGLKKGFLKNGVFSQTDKKLLQEEINVVQIQKLCLNAENIKKKEFLEKGFSKNEGFSANCSSSSVSYEAKKAHFISEIKRIFRINNEYNKIRESINQTDDFDSDFDFIDDREREAFETYQVLMENAGMELLDDPDVDQALEEIDKEFFGEIDYAGFDNLEKKGVKMEKKGNNMEKKGFLEKGFLKNGLFGGKGSSSASFEAKKAHFITEMQRILPIRNKYMKIKQAKNWKNNFNFVDDTEKEAFKRFNVLIQDAGFELLADPDVVRVMEEADEESLEEIIDHVGADNVEKKGFMEKGFLKNGVLSGKASFSSSSSESSYEARKRNFISELQRLLTIRNEYGKIREASKNHLDFIDDREAEAIEMFTDLMNNADLDLLEDPDVILVIAQKDCELEAEIADIHVEKSSMRAKKAKEMVEKPSMRAKKAKEEFVEGLKVGTEVRIVGGSNIGKKGKVLEVREKDDSVGLRFLNGDEVVVRLGDVAHLGSLVEDMCLAKLMDMKSKDKKAEDKSLKKLNNSEIKYNRRSGRNIIY